LDQARALAESYANHPVPHWRHRFRNVLHQLNGVEVPADPENREQDHNRLAAGEPRLALTLERRELRLDAANLTAGRLNIYPMDIELLFSRKPFLQGETGQLSFVRPVESHSIALPATFRIPEKFQHQNVMIEVVAGGLRRSAMSYAHALTVQLMENYGRLKVALAENGRPLSGVYVKVYARLQDGTVRFFKDGYTDFRGRFDYISLNTNDIDNTDKLAIMISSEEHGAVIREARPPKR
ncbi:MAG: hypothetical protein AAF492_12665, partial [Verrucomicrobiota bacterium]